MIEISVSSSKKEELIDITSQVQSAIGKLNIESGVCTIFTPHTTAAITINENADPDVTSDIKKELERIIPFDDNYKHLEGNSAAHIKASLIGSSETLFVENGEPLLGTWQGIYLCEFDGPRTRNVFVKIL